MEDGKKRELRRKIEESRTKERVLERMLKEERRRREEYENELARADELERVNEEEIKKKFDRELAKELEENEKKLRLESGRVEVRQWKNGSWAEIMERDEEEKKKKTEVAVTEAAHSSVQTVREQVAAGKIQDPDDGPTEAMRSYRFGREERRVGMNRDPSWFMHRYGVKMGRCNGCGELGHLQRDCPEVVCDECGERGHRFYECKQVECDKCGGRGHTKYGCPEAFCGECKRTGHAKRVCPRVECDGCGRRGHMVRDCKDRK